MTDLSPATSPTIPNVTDLKGFMLRIIAGLDPAESITPRLQALAANLDSAMTAGRYLDGVVEMAVASGHLDLLNRVLDEPLFCPTETSRSVDRDTRFQRSRLYGTDLFNGGLGIAVVDPTRQGRLSSTVTWTWADWARTREQGRGHPPEEGGPVVPKAPKDVQEASRFWSSNHQEACRVRYPQYRAHREVNLVGLAVMMGWGEGVQALLDHGVDPYARYSTETLDGSSKTFVSPVVLAGEYDEVDCLRRLMRHRSFGSRRLAGYGHDEKTWAKLKDKPALVPWRDGPRHGGLEIEFVLESAPAMADPVVRAVMRDQVNGLTRTWARKLTDPSYGLSPAAHRALETLTLESVLAEIPDDAPRSRKRL